MKGDIMPKRVYHLTIEFDPDTEEIEYIVETVEAVDADFIGLTQIGSIDIESLDFDKDTLREILQCYEMGEA